MASYSAQERAALTDLLLEVGPDAPTLCEGWTTRDLAAHLVIRERRPDTAPGIMIPAFSGWTEQVRLSYCDRDFDELVELYRSGPARVSIAALPKMDELMNTGEHFIHHEDIRRAQHDWKPRDLEKEFQRNLWGRLKAMAGMVLRSSPGPVTLHAPGFGGIRLNMRMDGDEVTVTGTPAELMLYTAGRTSASIVDITGESEAVEQFTAWPHKL